jgi:hypothetical protein
MASREISRVPGERTSAMVLQRRHRPWAQTPRRWNLLTICGGLGMLVASQGCFFETREPESGQVEACYEVKVADRVQTVFDNLDGSMDCFQAETYVSQLTDDFRYIPPPSVAQGLPDPWTKAQERQFVDRLFADADSVESHLKLEEIQVSGTDPLEVEAKYRVRVVSGGSATEYAGEVFYRLRQEGTVWRLFEWEEKDSRVPLGQLKGGLVGTG